MLLKPGSPRICPELLTANRSGCESALRKVSLLKSLALPIPTFVLLVSQTQHGSSPPRPYNHPRPYESLRSLPAWISKNFTVSPGGQHADGKTENKLICFEDGSYIELIAFIDDDPKNREGHWWGGKKFGIIDFAFTGGDADTNFRQIQSRLEGIENGKVAYHAPVQGGRRRDDGRELIWKVTFPNVTNGFQRGELPFFCHDITPRSLRVPFTEESVTHPNLGYGIKRMSIYVPEERVPSLVAAYAAILDVPSPAAGDSLPHRGVFEVSRINQIKGAKDISVSVQAPPEEWQVKNMEERGGAMLGDMVVGGLSIVGGNGTLIRIDTEGEGVGRILLDLDLDSPPVLAAQHK